MTRALAPARLGPAEPTSRRTVTEVRGTQNAGPVASFNPNQDVDQNNPSACADLRADCVLGTYTRLISYQITAYRDALAVPTKTLLSGQSLSRFAVSDLYFPDG